MVTWALIFSKAGYFVLEILVHAALSPELSILASTLPIPIQDTHL